MPENLKLRPLDTTFEISEAGCKLWQTVSAISQGRYQINVPTKAPVYVSSLRGHFVRVGTRKKFGFCVVQLPWLRCQTVLSSEKSTISELMGWIFEEPLETDLSFAEAMKLLGIRT